MLLFLPGRLLRLLTAVEAVKNYGIRGGGKGSVVPQKAVATSPVRKDSFGFTFDDEVGTNLLNLNIYDTGSKSRKFFCFVYL